MQATKQMLLCVECMFKLCGQCTGSSEHVLSMCRNIPGYCLKVALFKCGAATGLSHLCID